MDIRQGLEMTHSQARQLWRALWVSAMQLTKDSWPHRLWRALWVSDEQLTKDEAASTFFRFFKSKHVDDLRLIAKVATIGLTLFIVAIILLHNTAQEFETKDMLAFIGSAFSAYGVIIAWTYLSASARLGIVDLFACEIATLCRVGTVLDVGQRYVDMIEKKPAEPGGSAIPHGSAGPRATAGPHGTAGPLQRVPVIANATFVRRV
jgi:hypothetical protein